MKEMTKKAGVRMQGKTLSQANEALIQEYLDIVANDSENLDRTMGLMADDCVWVMEPTGDTYSGREEIEAFVGTAMSGRTHQGQYRIQISNWFTDGEYLCIEYTHGAMLTGVYSAGIKARLKPGISRYCITFHMRDGKFDWAHEYIQGTTFLTNFAMPLMLKRMKRLVEKKLSRRKSPSQEAESRKLSGGKLR
jgi:ketosteroid isomerase-like protein